MTTYVILGHGGFNQDSDRYPPEVLIPVNTTMKFWSEAGADAVCQLRALLKSEPGQWDAYWATAA